MREVNWPQRNPQPSLGTLHFAGMSHGASKWRGENENRKWEEPVPKKTTQTKQGISIWVWSRQNYKPFQCCCGRASTMRLRGCGSNPQPGATSDYKNGRPLPACLALRNLLHVYWCLFIHLWMCLATDSLKTSYFRCPSSTSWANDLTAPHQAGHRCYMNFNSFQWIQLCVNVCFSPV